MPNKKKKTGGRVGRPPIDEHVHDLHIKIPSLMNQMLDQLIRDGHGDDKSTYVRTLIRERLFQLGYIAGRGRARPV